MVTSRPRFLLKTMFVFMVRLQPESVLKFIAHVVTRGLVEAWSEMQLVALLKSRDHAVAGAIQT